ncbi:NAD-dependent epimerase/dehydratase family protein [Pseudoalteromonas sp. CAL260-MNA-CIBAN-0059]|uniref:NAD-dependent epimerase/dehydratase family protein n=1 Tax=Pseudoalteromonas sp. CAL260-MNA-CIBAN-0059 TaxID=3140430 RepID=UPI003321E989
MNLQGNNLVVLGAGWLGSALCVNAQQAGWQVQGTHRSAVHEHDFERQFLLENGQLTHQIDLQNAYWVCAIPPRSRHSESNYAQTLTAALTLAKKLNAKGFLLCSSTGVYDQEPGVYSESSDISCTNERQIKLYEAEEQVLEQNGKVLRLAGLVGPNREPGRFIAGKELNTSAEQVVNMVHQQDVINAIFAVLEHWHQGQSIYNVVNPSHPCKRDYYAQKCQQHGGEMPRFTGADTAERKVLGSAIEALGFSYQYAI